MATRTKIKMIDNSGLRKEIDTLYEQTSQVDLAEWALECAKHVQVFTDPAKIDMTIIENGFRISELWQAGKATVHEIRQAGFKIHEAARKCKSEIVKNAIRTAGHAVGVGHMRQHAMVCSDYAIKTVQLAYSDNIDKISEERLWQLNELRKVRTGIS
jgi:hypothetical protein